MYSRILLSAILLGAIVYLFSCKKEEPKCENGLNYKTWSDCKCPEGYVLYPSADYKTCSKVVGFAAKYLIKEVPDGFLEGQSRSIYMDFNGQSRLFPAPLGEPNTIRIGLLKDNFEISKYLLMDMIAYSVNNTKDSFVLDFRKLANHVGFNADGEGLVLTGTVNDIAFPYSGWTWNVMADSFATTPVRTYPAEVIY